MPQIMREVSLLTVTSNPNVLTGSAFEYVRQNAVLSMGVAQSATGMFTTINVGSDVVCEEFSPPILTRYPIIPDEMYFQDVAAGGDRIVIAFRNPTGGTLIARAVVIVTNI